MLLPLLLPECFSLEDTEMDEMWTDLDEKARLEEKEEKEEEQDEHFPMAEEEEQQQAPPEKNAPIAIPEADFQESQTPATGKLARNPAPPTPAQVTWHTC
jgi:hypothetical protein